MSRTCRLFPPAALLLLAALTGCSHARASGEAPPLAPPSPQHPVAGVYREGIEAFNAQRLEAFMAGFGEDVELYTHQGWLRGREAVRARFAELFRQFPRMRMEVGELRVRALTPEVAVVDFRARTYPQGSGPAYHTTGTGVYVLRGGRWVEVMEHETTTHADPPLPLGPPDPASAPVQPRTP